MSREEEAALARASKEQMEKDLRRRTILEELGKRAEGREFIWWLLEITDVFGEAFSSDALRMAHVTGRQAVGRQVMAEFIDASPQGYLQLLLERAAADARLREEIENVRRTTGNTGNY